MNYVELRIDRRIAVILLVLALVYGMGKVAYKYGYEAAIRDAIAAMQQMEAGRAN